MSLPPAARRLFPHYDEVDLTLERVRSLLIARLLEDGDAADLAWMLDAVGEAAVADWFAQHGGRQISRRSRAFWEIVLGQPSGPVHPEVESLWPL